jgi:solute carrier family 13 (sodium-dependent dicarboxylate transporter), member 2/3/5
MTDGRIIFTYKKGICFAVSLLLFAAICAWPEPSPIQTATKTISLTFPGKVSLAVLLMAVFLWITEALPFSVTGLFGIVLLVMTKTENFDRLVTIGFGNPIILFFIGTLLISAAISKTPLLKRATNFMLFRFGHSPSLIILIFLLESTLLSSCVSSLPAAAMMFPVGLSLLKSAGLKPMESNFGKALMIACAWGSSIGGISTPAASGANVLTIGFLKDIGGIDITFIKWMAIGFPAAVLMIPFAWMILLRLFKPEELRIGISVDEYMARKSDMGPLGREEKVTVCVFLLTVGLWITGPLIKILTDDVVDYLSISFVSVLCSCILFMPGIRIISWKEAEEGINWNSILLIATGLALGMTLYNTGAAQWIAYVAFHTVGMLPPVLIIFSVIIGVTFLKLMFSSNTLTAIILVPLLIALAQMTDLDPRMLALPAGITSSLAFVLVTSTPNNLIPYSSGYFSIKDMAKAGMWMTLAGALCITLSIYVMGNITGLIIL